MKSKVKNLFKSFHNKFQNQYEQSNQSEQKSKYKSSYISFSPITSSSSKMAGKTNNHHAFANNNDETMSPRYSVGATSRSKNKPKSVIKVAVNLLHRFVTVVLRLLIGLALGTKGKSMPPITDCTLLESATSLAYKIRKQKLTSVEVLKSYIERIKQVNPLLNCVVDNRFEDALKEAAEADALIASGKYTEDELAKLKPFLGVPISTKDCIQVKGMLHTAGLWVRRHIHGDRDADCIALMRKAGAIPFALTNVSECCMWWESSNPVHGRTRNPYDTNRIVGGSSGGEGCIQAAAASPFGIGSDIGGSIRIPAFFNGIFGHKPSKNIVSNKGQYPIPFNEEQNAFLGIGPMCRYAIDLKPMLKIIADENVKLLKLDEQVHIEKINFFYQESDGGGHLISPVDPDIREALHKVVKHIENVTNKKPKKIQLEKFKQSTSIWLANMQDNSEYKFDAQLANLKGRINPYTELLKWLVGASNHTFVGLMTAIVERHGVQYDTPQYHHLVNKRNELIREIQEILGDNGVLLYPTHPTVAPYHNEPIFRSFNFSYTAIINVLGFPATAIPLGIGSEGLPLGIQVIANHNQDHLCLAVAAELERAFGGWVPPKILA